MKHPQIITYRKAMGEVILGNSTKHSNVRCYVKKHVSLRLALRQRSSRKRAGPHCGYQLISSDKKIQNSKKHVRQAAC